MGPGMTPGGIVDQSVRSEMSRAQTDSLYGRLVKPTLTINATRGHLKTATYQRSNSLLLQHFADGKLLVWDFNQGGQIDEFALPATSTPVHYDAAAARLYALSRSSLLRVRRGGATGAASEVVIEKDVTAASASDDGRWLFAGTASGEVIKLDINGKVSWSRKALGAAVREIVPSFDGSHVAALGATGEAASMGDTGSPLLTPRVEHLVGYDRAGQSLKLLSDRGIVSVPVAGTGAAAQASFTGAESVAVNSRGDRFIAVMRNGRFGIVAGSGLTQIDDGVKFAAFLDDKRYVYVKANGVTYLRSLDLNYYLVAIVPSPTGWAVVDHEGRYDGTVVGSKDITWKADDNVMTLDQFFDNYFQPGLLSSYIKDQEKGLPQAPVDLKKGVFPPPKVELDFPDKVMRAGKEFRVVAVAESRGGELSGEIRLFYNGKRLAPKGRVGAQSYRKGNRLLQVEVFAFTPIPGLNEVYAEASNAHGVAGRSEVKKMSAEGQRPAGKLYIVGIGVDKYKDATLNLDYAVTDVTALIERIQRGARGSYAEVVTRTLFDRRATRAGVNEVLAALRDAGTQDSLLVVMAGHGDTRGGEWYFIPHDIDLDKVRSTGVSAREIQDALVGSAAGSIFLLIDACHSGAGIDDFNHYRNFQRRFAQQMGRSAGIAVLMAARRDQYALESKSIGHGLFTHTVLAGLDGAADVLPKDNKVSAHELARYVAENLREKSIQLVQLMGGDRNLQAGSAATASPAASSEPPRIVQEPAHFVIGADFLVSDVKP